MDRLTSFDASILAQERGSHMHIGGILIFEGPPPVREELNGHISSRLHLVPRYRQRLAFPRFEMGRPLWIEDPRFNIDYHVRHTALPAPGTAEQLRLLAARIFSQRLDRSKPLWEIWLVEGLEDGRFALVNKTHHCLVDGVSGVDITAVLLDLDREPAEKPAAGEEWTPGPEPSDAQIVGEGVRGLVRAPLGLAGAAAGALQRPGAALDRARQATEGLGEVAWGIVNRSPETPLNVKIGPHRRLRWVRTRLENLEAIKNGLGGTVNDVFLALVTGALRRRLRDRGLRTEALELRGCVPVSVRTEGEQGQLGNKITMMTCPLPVYADEPERRFKVVSEAMCGLKHSKQALGAEVIAGLQEFAPPTVFARASRLNFSSRVYNLLVTNVPGPQFPLYLLGRELLELVPVPFLAPDKALAIAIMSYNGGVDIGLMGDHEAMPDLDDFAGHREDELEALMEAAGVAPKGPARENAGVPEPLS
ncbi:MAG TPA: wax ester/triacylglycerol synthase family O-acyltransferase [Thermoleophilaceae bacterium]|nr:wax ester/triacylglycerol synthase family O-acyltransferase [Thermoleophilaceae bacterium]